MTSSLVFNQKQSITMPTITDDWRLEMRLKPAHVRALFNAIRSDASFCYTMQYLLPTTFPLLPYAMNSEPITVLQSYAYAKMGVYDSTEV